MYTLPELFDLATLLAFICYIFDISRAHRYGGNQCRYIRKPVHVIVCIINTEFAMLVNNKTCHCCIYVVVPTRTTGERGRGSLSGE